MISYYLRNEYIFIIKFQPQAPFTWRVNLAGLPEVLYLTFIRNDSFLKPVDHHDSWGEDVRC